MRETGAKYYSIGRQAVREPAVSDYLQIASSLWSLWRLLMKAFRMSGILLWGLAALWFALMTFLSSQPGEDTLRTSLQLVRFLLSVLHLPESRLGVLHTGLRIAAHFAVFFVLGGLLYTAMLMTLQKLDGTLYWTIGLCSIIGILDEVKKVFISGRHLCLEETALNVIGALCGIIAVMAAMELVLAGSKVEVPR